MKKTISILLYILTATVTYSQAKINNRPQTPQPPFDYFTDSVEYESADRAVKLGGTLSYPKTRGPFITLVMITGSGQQDRDETLFGHKPFAVIADHLTRHGYAVLRVDDRGKGKSIGKLMNATSLDFTEDVITSIHYLQTRKEVDPKKIGVIGHSEGGFIAPIVYSKWKDLAFIISLAGTGVPGRDILLKQQTDPVKGQVSQAAFDAYYELTQKTLSLVHDNPTTPDSLVLEEVKKIYRDWKAKLPDSVLIPLRADRATPEAYASQVRQELIPWLRYFISTDPGDFWSKVKCPVLAINGDKDIQVDALQNISGIRRSLKKAHNKKLTTVIIPGLNHLFQTCDQCTIDEYGKLEETFSPAALNLITEWLDKNIK